MADEDERWKLISRRTVVQDPWLTVYEDSYRLPDGTELEEYHALEERNGVIIVALTEQRAVLLVRQYRPGADRSIYELPAGFMEQDESDARQRAESELRQETGHEAAQWHALGELHDLPSRMRKTTFCFVALDARRTAEQDEDSTEFVGYEALPLPEVRQMIGTGAITSAVTIAALFKAELWLEHAAGVGGGNE